MELAAALLFVVVGTLALYLALAAAWSRQRILRDWIKLENARVVESQVETSGLWAYPLIVYEYHSCDIHYVGQFTPTTLFPGAFGYAQRVVSNYTPGRVITIYVNPDNHQLSLLHPSPPLWVCFTGLCVPPPATPPPRSRSSVQRLR